MKQIVKKITDLSFFYKVSLILSMINIVSGYLGFNLNKVYLIWGLLIILYDTINTKRVSFHKDQILLYAIIVLQLMIILFKDEKIRNISQLLYLSIYFIVFAKPWCNKKDTHKEIFDYNMLFIYVAMIMNFVSVLVYVLNISVNFENIYNVTIYIGNFNGEAAGIYGNANDFGFISMIGVMFTYINFRIYKTNKHVLTRKYDIDIININFVLSCIGLVICKSRGGLICTVAFFVFLFVLNQIKKVKIKIGAKTKKIIAITPIILLISSVFYLNNYYYENLKNGEIKDIAVEEREFSSGRISIWAYGSEVSMENPLLGVGFGDTSQRIGELDNKRIFWWRDAISIHNAYLEILVATGIIGFTIAYLYFYKTIKKAYLKIKDDDVVVSLLALFFSFLVLAFVDSTIIYPFYFVSVIFWSYLGIIQSQFKKDGKDNVVFLIGDLKGGGAERVLIDTVNKLDKNKYNITLYCINNWIKYEGELSDEVHYESMIHKPDTFIGKVTYKIIWKYLSCYAHDYFISKDYDIEIAFLEGIPTKIISKSTNTKSLKLTWVHIDLYKFFYTNRLFHSLEDQINCYKKFDQIVCVSDTVKEAFQQRFFSTNNIEVMYNVIDFERIQNISEENVELPCANNLRLVTIGRLTYQKGFDRLINVVTKINSEGIDFDLLILGEGEDRKDLENQISNGKLEEIVCLKGFVSNPYKYLSKSDLFVCSSRSEGYSTVATEALILGVPVITVDVSGMKELLNNNEYGVMVENSEDELYRELKTVLTNKSYYTELKEKAEIYKKRISTDRNLKDLEKNLHKWSKDRRML